MELESKQFSEPTKSVFLIFKKWLRQIVERHVGEECAQHNEHRQEPIFEMILK